MPQSSFRKSLWISVATLILLFCQTGMAQEISVDCVLSSSSAAQTSLTSGQILHVAVKEGEESLSDLATFRLRPSPAFENLTKDDDEEFVLRALAAGTHTLFITRMDNSASCSVQIKVEAFNPRLVAHGGNTAAMDQLRLLPGDSCRVQDDTLTWIADNKEIGEIKDGLLSPFKPGAVTFKAFADTEQKALLGQVTIHVTDPVKEVKLGWKPGTEQKIYVFEGETADLPKMEITKHGGPGSESDVDYRVSVGSQGISVAQGRVRTTETADALPEEPREKRRATITIVPKVDVTVCSESSRTFLDKSLTAFDVVVLGNPGRVTFDLENTAPVLMSQQIKHINARLQKGSKTNPADFQWSIGGDNQEERLEWEQAVKLVDEGNGRLAIVGVFKPEDLKANPALRKPVPIVATLATSPNLGLEIRRSGTFYVRLRAVAGFEPLRVKINMVDQQLAADLFGKKTAQEFYVARVRMINDLKDDATGTFLGSSILAFSESIEVAVTLEKRYDGKSNRVFESYDPTGKPIKDATRPTDEKWHELDLFDIFSLDLEYPGDIEDCQPFGSPSLKRKEVTKEMAELKILEKEVEKSDSLNPGCEGQKKFITYRPYAYEMIVNSVDPRDNRTTRSKVFKFLKGMALVASTVTSVAIPSNSNSFTLGLEKYSNLFIPGFEKLIPSMKETERQNVVNMTMRQIEEIPFGSDIARIIFFPKRPFAGLLPSYKVRIASVNPYYFKIKVAVLDRAAQGTVEARSSIEK